MAQIKLPSIDIIFKELGTSAIDRGETGVIALVLEQTGVTNPKVFNVYSALNIPSELDEKNTRLVELCLKGSARSVRKVVVVLCTETVAGMNALSNVDYNWLATPYADSMDYDNVISVVGNLRDNGKMVKYVVAGKQADKPFVVNFGNSTIKLDTDEVFTPEEFTARMVGLIASVPLSISVTYQPLLDVVEVETLTKEALDTAISTGKLMIYNDGRKIKIARGVTSLQTSSADMPESFKKIKILAIADLMKSDIRTTLEDSYIGKYPCDYDHKCLLISAINSYLKLLEGDMLLDKGSKCEIDVDRHRIYLEGKGINTESMSNDEIMMANTGDEVFLKINAKILDAIEDVAIEILI